MGVWGPGIAQILAENGHLSSVNVGNAVQLGINQRLSYEANLIEKFYEQLSKSVSTMNALKCLKVGNAEIIDTV